MPTFEVMMFYFSLVPGDLKVHSNQTYCKWVDAYSIMSHVTMEYDLVRKMYLLDPVDAKS